MPGESQKVTVTIDSSASNHPLSYWVPENDAPVPGWANGSWCTAPGDYTVHVGTSSAETALQQSVTLADNSSASCPTSPPSESVPDHPLAIGAPVTPPNWPSLSMMSQWLAPFDLPVPGENQQDRTLSVVVGTTGISPVHSASVIVSAEKLELKSLSLEGHVRGIGYRPGAER